MKRKSIVEIVYNQNLLGMKRKSFIKMIALSLMTLLSMGGLTACGSDDDGGQGNIPDPSDDPTPDVFHPINASTRPLLEVKEYTAYDPTELVETIIKWPMITYAGETVANFLRPMLNLSVSRRMPQMDDLFAQRVGTAPDGSRQWNLRRYVFTYKSVSGSTGNDTILTGSVIFPTNTVGKPHEVDVLTLYHHQAYFDDSWLASQAVTLMAMHTMHNSAVIEPDGQGAKSEMETLITENLQGDLTALQMADCVLAALEVMRNQGVTLAAGGYSNNWGTSLGATATAGFAQYMDNDATTDLKQLFRVRASYMGEGPTQISQLNGYEHVWENPPVQKFQVGWNPRHPFYISTCPNDELIKYDELKKYYNKLRLMPDGSLDTNVHWIDLNVPHLPIEQEIDEEVGNHLLSAVITLLYISLVKDPSEIVRAQNE